MTTIAAILTRAQALAAADTTGILCAYITITDAGYQPPTPESPRQIKDALRIYATVIGVDPDAVPQSIWKWWDASDQAARDASWDRAKARAAAMGEG